MLQAAAITTEIQAKVNLVYSLVFAMPHLNQIIKGATKDESISAEKLGLLVRAFDKAATFLKPYNGKLFKAVDAEHETLLEMCDLLSSNLEEDKTGDKNIEHARTAIRRSVIEYTTARHQQVASLTL